MPVKSKGSQDKYPPPSTEFSTHWIPSPQQNLFSKDSPPSPSINKYGFTPTANRKIKKMVFPLPDRLKWNSP